MDSKQINERIRSSLELQVLWRNLILDAVITVAMILLLGLTRGRSIANFGNFAALMIGVLVVPLLIFSIIRTISIFRKSGHYIFCQTVLAQPKGGPLRDTICYTVVLEDPEDGSKFVADTHAIFYSHGSMDPNIEEYTNKTVTIAYNQETGMVVVIG